MVDRTVFPAPDLPSSTVSFAKGDNVANASGLDVFDMECMKIAISMVKNPLTGNFDTPLPVVMALVLREGIGLFQFLNRITRPSTSLRWIGHSSWRPVPLDAAAEHHTIGRMYWLAFPYGLDTYTWDNATAPNTTGKMDTHFKSRLELLITTQPVLTGTTKEDLLSFVNERVGSDFNPGDPFPSIYKLHKRVHAVFITLMLAWFQHMHDTILNKRNGLTYTNADWTADDFSSIQDTITSVDTRRRDFITYYSMIYLLYNGSVGSWNAITNSVQNAGARGATKVRDYLLFKFVIGAGQELGPCNMLHYAIGLDAFCRLNFTTPSTAPDTTSPTGRAWI
jgi:hypothetical protein